MTIALLALVILLAFGNGSNDNGKGVATLVGFGVAKPFQALVFASGATAIGGIVSFYFAASLLKSFSGAWLFGSSVHLGLSFYLAVLIGACSWVLLATQTGMPVSTTHAIIGALCGAGYLAFGSHTFQWRGLGTKFLVPLALSPILSLAVVYLVSKPLVFFIESLGERCICVVDQTVLPMKSSVAVLGNRTELVQSALVIDQVSNCSVAKPVVTLSGTPVLNTLHWTSAGLISFARGWNDTPKIAALSLLALTNVNHGAALGFLAVVVGMAIGGMVAGKKVLDTLAQKVTPLPLAQSLTASLATAVLVALASWKSLPVSTTHVATGAIVGAGVKNDPSLVRWSKVGEIAISWVITLPVAALIAAGAKLLLR